MIVTSFLCPLVICTALDTVSFSHKNSPDSSIFVGQDSVCVLGQVMHKSAIETVHSLTFPEKNAIDTLPTVVPGVSVVLYNDNTWHYHRSLSYMENSAVMTEYWDPSKTNPYLESRDSLPEAWAVWLVDSLSEYHVPLTGRVTSKFGFRYGRSHQGTDIGIPTGNPVYAPFNGKVRFAGTRGGYGRLVIIRHNNGLETFYGHLSAINVEPDAYVRAGDVIGMSGNSGRSTGPHLHIETRYRGLAFDSQRIFDYTTGDLKQRMMVLKRRYFGQYSTYDQNFDDEFLNLEDDKKALEAQRKAQEEAALKARVYHIVRNGENLSVIAKRYRTTVNAICRLNGIKAEGILKVGKKLRVR